jgi:uncharacterized protein with PhoU and TrkA domain
VRRIEYKNQVAFVIEVISTISSILNVANAISNVSLAKFHPQTVFNAVEIEVL